MSSEALRIGTLLEKSCLSCIRPIISAAKFRLSLETEYCNIQHYWKGTCLICIFPRHCIIRGSTKEVQPHSDCLSWKSWWKRTIQCWLTFKNCAILLTETPWIFFCADDSIIHGLDGLLKQESTRQYCATLNQKIWMHWFLCVILPCSTDISASAEVFPARIRVSGPPRHPWSTASAKIAPPRWPKLPILKLGLPCCWRGAFISVDILASTSPPRAPFRVYVWKIRVW